MGTPYSFIKIQRMENKMLEANITISSCQVVVSHNTFEKFDELMHSLPKKVSNAATFENTNGSFIKLCHDPKFNNIDIYYGGITQEGVNIEPMKFGKVTNAFNGHNVLEFYFNFAETISVREDGYYYNDYSGVFRLMNNLLEENIFKIKEV